MPVSDYGTFSTTTTIVSGPPTLRYVRTVVQGQTYKVLSKALDRALYELLKWSTPDRPPLIMLGEGHGVREDLLLQLFVMDALERLEDDLELDFDILGVELSTKSLPGFIVSKLERCMFAANPVTFGEKHEQNVYQLLAFAIIRGWDVIGCEPKQESSKNLSMDFSSRSEARDKLFERRNQRTVKRLLEIRAPLLYVCGVGHLRRLVESRRLEDAFTVVPIVMRAEWNREFVPQNCDLIEVVVPGSNVPGLIASHLKKHHPSLPLDALKTTESRILA